ncbi:MAG: ATP-binding protein [Pseudohongiellaceae bacterium]
MYSRKLVPRIEEMLKEFRVVYLTGPRQAGKTTVVRALAEQVGMQYMTLDQQAVLESAMHDPHGLIEGMGDNKVALDEFQYAPSLIPAIKAVSDALPRTERGKFLLTGSADIFRSAKAQESLPGHMARLELYPLAIGELTGRSHNLVDYLCAGEFQTKAVSPLSRDQIGQWILQGGYPEVQDLSPRARQAWFRSYVEGRLFKDFETLYTARGDYHSRLQALAPYLAGLCGNLLKYASIANDLGLDDKVVKAYMEILELMFIVRRVPAWLKNRAKRLVSGMPKLHYVDTGLACHLLGLRTAEQLFSSQYYGGLLENLLYMECCKQAGWAQEDISLYHFRDNRKHEVDLVIEQSNGEIIGVEIKASASIRMEDFKGLNILADYAGSKFRHGVVLYTGREILPFTHGQNKFHAVPVGLLLG